jgi:hypothetical protein
MKRFIDEEYTTSKEQREREREREREDIGKEKANEIQYMHILWLSLSYKKK